MKLRNLFKRKKKTKQDWGKPKNPSPLESALRGELTPSKSTVFQPVKVKKPRKIRIPGLRTAKRTIAGIMLLINLLVALSGLSFSGGAILAFIFFLNVFIFLDYLHKTKKVKVNWEEENK